ncbi:response regulator transcription factor [Arenicella sp. 4NH20-0111]|uniref:response regulator transcription factor n=1 Tax=Arenicella sp. 4NH20-0111 TaxID=3127648 RepID=UPI00310C558E
MKLLIAEDDALIRDGLVDILSTEGFDCIAAQDGNEAWVKYQEAKPDMVLLDIMMPGQDGYSVCRRIRQSDEQTAIMFISAKSEEIDRVLGLELGADDYLMKPFGKHEVLARVRAIFRRYKRDSIARTPQVEPAQVFMMHDLKVDPEQLRASRGQATFDLSLRDCSILSYLFRNRNKVVTRDELFNQCWGRDYMPSSRTLDQHISQLRKLVEPDPKSPSLIRTVHGVGYRYETG